MKDAILITGLKTQRVRRETHARYYDLPATRPIMAGDGALLLAEESVSVRVVPITQFCGRGKPDVYIAVSHEVEEILGIPFNVILKERQQYADECGRLRDKVSALQSVTLWQHFKASVSGLISRLRVCLR